VTGKLLRREDIPELPDWANAFPYYRDAPWDDVKMRGYGAMHDAVKRARGGPAKKFQCMADDDCDEMAWHFAFVGDASRAVWCYETHGKSHRAGFRLYSLRLTDYEPLCKKHHAARDVKGWKEELARTKNAAQERVDEFLGWLADDEDEPSGEVPAYIPPLPVYIKPMPAFQYTVTTSNQTTLYPCDRGTGTPLGYHNYAASANGIVVCTWCGRKS
jgi:hypothetical protein